MSTRTRRPRTLRESLAAAQNASNASADPFEGEAAVTKDDAAQRRGILVRVDTALWRRIKLAAVDRGVTVQALMLTAIDDALAEHDHRPSS
jgi:hypothetical protein